MNEVRVLGADEEVQVNGGVNSYGRISGLMVRLALMYAYRIIF